MKNNTKLIMETWRRFLKEGPDGTDKPLPGEPPFESEEPLEGDPDLEGYNDDPYDPEYNPKGRDPDFGHDPDGYSEITDDQDMYGDPAIQTGDAPMLGMSGDDGSDYDDDSSEYESRSTFDGMPEDEFYDYSDDSEGDF